MARSLLKRGYILQVPTFEENKEPIEVAAEEAGFGSVASYLRHLIKRGLEQDNGYTWRL